MGNPDEATTLFVYGSLLDESHREEILGRRVETAPATICDYERGRERHYFIGKRVGIDTPGLLLLGLTVRDFTILDRYEQVPALYMREKVTAIDASGEAVRCWVYMPTPLTFRDV